MRFLLVLSLLFSGFVTVLSAEDLTAAQKTSVDAKLAKLVAWGTDANVVKLVKAAEATPFAWASAMTQEKWTGLSVLSPEIKDITKGELTVYLRGRKDDQISEIFVSGKTGTKIAFLAKTSSWSHKGKPKHDLPMTGKTWVGTVETDESTGLKQVQVSFPILDGAKVLGSIVVGLALSKL